jgi:hypothetical protein
MDAELMEGKYGLARTELRSSLERLYAQRRKLEDEIAHTEDLLDALESLRSDEPPLLVGDQAESVGYIGRKILEWARDFLDRSGSTNIGGLYKQLPQDLRSQFDAARATQPPLLRFRRLFRRSPHLFSVRRSDGLVELIAPRQDVDHGALVSASVTKNGERSFLVRSHGSSEVVSLDGLRKAILEGQPHYVRGRDGVLSTVVLREGLIRSVSDHGQLNNDIATLRHISLEGEVPK